MTEKTPEGIFSEYQLGIDYKNSINLFETVRTNENFYVGRQWEGLKVERLDPLIFNIIKRVVNLFVSLIVSDDVSATVTPAGPPDDSRTGRILDRALSAAIERTGAKAKNREMLKNCCVDGDGCFYLYFDPGIETGKAYKGDIAVDVCDNTRVHFGNPQVGDVQRQPYIIIEMRMLTEDARSEAIKNGIPRSQALSIRPDAGRDPDGDGKTTVLLKLWRQGGTIRLIKTARESLIKPETDTGYRLYPLAWMSWDRVKNSFHGVSPVTGAIPNQIAINKLYSMYVHCIKQAAFPKIIYDMTRFPNGFPADIGRAVGMRGNPNDAVLSAFRAPDISSHVMPAIKQMISDTVELMGASDVILGNVRPENTSAIIAVQKASLAPLELVRLEFYRFVEDCLRIFLDIMRVNYGEREVVIENDQGGESAVSFDFSKLDSLNPSLTVEVGASSYWSEMMQTTTNDNLFLKGIIKDPIVYVQNIPNSQIRGKASILKALREERERAARPQAINGANL